MESEPTALASRAVASRRESLWVSYKRLWRTLVSLYRS
ncbi:Major facilitator superfamily MFS_1, partial [human gut metagenome]